VAGEEAEWGNRYRTIKLLDPLVKWKDERSGVFCFLFLSHSTCHVFFSFSLFVLLPALARYDGMCVRVQWESRISVSNSGREGRVMNGKTGKGWMEHNERKGDQRFTVF